MSRAKRPACALDLDGTLNHAAPAAGSRRIRGRTTHSFLSGRTLERLARLSRRIDIIVATGRSRHTAGDFIRAFAQSGVGIAGWIFEHGAVVEGRPEWSRRVTAGIDMAAVRRGLGGVIRAQALPIDMGFYADSHEHILLLSGNGALLAEHLILCAADILGDDFRTIPGRRKIALIPRRADKFAAFAANFGATHFLAFAAGDQPDDLTLLGHAALPLAHAGAHPLVREVVRSRQGVVAPSSGHEGTAAMLDAILAGAACPGREGPPAAGPLRPGASPAKLPLEEAAHFRPSRRAYLDRLFAASAMPETVPDPGFLRRLGGILDAGRGVVIEVRMRDWGGEAKPLAVLMGAMMPYLPRARWRLCFRTERRGVENLTDFAAVVRRLEGLGLQVAGGGRLSAPGVPGSPADPKPPDAVLMLFDHPQDLGRWYAAAMPRLITRHPRRPGAFWVNPMYLKISSAPAPPGRRVFADPSTRVMMAANVIGETDIRLAAAVFGGLRDQVDALIIAPRVVTNPRRNRVIREAAAAVGETAVPLSAAAAGGRPGVVWVDTYGDLAGLYGQCRFTYLGGGFNPRKRGFDPVESLHAGVPVIMGPLCDYNRVAVRLLAGSRWITRLETPETAVRDAAEAARRLMADPPEAGSLQGFFRARRIDALQVALEVMAHLAGLSRKGYLLPENGVFPWDVIRPETLLPDENALPGKSS